VIRKFAKNLEIISARMVVNFSQPNFYTRGVAFGVIAGLVERPKNVVEGNHVPIRPVEIARRIYLVSVPATRSPKHCICPEINLNTFKDYFYLIYVII